MPVLLKPSSNSENIASENACQCLIDLNPFQAVQIVQIVTENNSFLIVHFYLSQNHRSLSGGSGGQGGTVPPKKILMGGLAPPIIC